MNEARFVDKQRTAGRTIGWISLDLAAAIFTYAMVIRVRQYGATCILGIALMFTSSLALGVRRLRHRLKWLAALYCMLSAIQVLTVSTTFVGLTFPGLIAALCFSGSFVLTAALMTTSSLGVPLWPHESQGRDLVITNAWLTCVLGPATAFVLSVMITLLSWGLHWARRSSSCFGLDTGSMVMVATLVPLCYLLAHVLRAEKGVRLPAPLSEYLTNTKGKAFALAALVFYFSGLELERVTTQQYIRWTLVTFLTLVITLQVVALLYLERTSRGDEATAGVPWSRRAALIHALWIVAYSLLYTDVARCVLR
jgi:hypothetical protein